MSRKSSHDSYRDAESKSSSRSVTEYPENLVQDFVADDDLDVEQIGGQSHALRRTTTGASTYSVHTQTLMARVLSERSENRVAAEEKTPLPKIGGGKDFPPDLPDRDPWRVDFDGEDDPTFTQNWPFKTRFRLSVVLAFTSFTSTWTSAIVSAGSQEIAQTFHVGGVVAALTTALYVMGYGTGPIIWAPLSELYGRKMPMVISNLGFASFCFGGAVAKDFQTLVICRFFAGLFASAPLSVVAAAFADMYTNKTRGYAMICFAATVFCGPTLAPVAGFWIEANSHMGWRWLMYISGIMGCVAFFLILFFFKETFPPIILCRKASELRRRTGNWGIYAPHEVVELDINEIITKNFTRPLRLLFTEPIIFLVTLYTAFIYGILYLTLSAYPIIFVEGYQFQGGIGGLPYIGLAIGCLFCMLSIVFFFEPKYLQAIEKNNWKPVPEMRLWPMMAGAISFPIGLFWLTWCGAYHEHVHWAVTAAAGIFIGYGLLGIFLPALSYIIDSYLMFAASAVAANTILRSGFGGAFPLFASAMFHNLGTQWAGTLLGCIGVVLAPVPIMFYIFGKKIRQKSKFAFDLS